MHIWNKDNHKETITQDEECYFQVIHALWNLVGRISSAQISRRESPELLHHPAEHAGNSFAGQTLENINATGWQGRREVEVVFGAFKLLLWNGQEVDLLPLLSLCNRGDSARGELGICQVISFENPCQAQHWKRKRNEFWIEGLCALENPMVPLTVLRSCCSQPLGSWFVLVQLRYDSCLEDFRP